MRDSVFIASYPILIDATGAQVHVRNTEINIGSSAAIGIHAGGSVGVTFSEFFNSNGSNIVTGTGGQTCIITSVEYTSVSTGALSPGCVTH